MIKENQGQRKSRVYTGLFLLGAGLLVLAHKLGSPIPEWVFSFGTLFICIGLLTGLRTQFSNAVPFVFLAVGTVFLADEFIPQMHIENYLAPIILMSIGVIFIFRPSESKRIKGRSNRQHYTEMPDPFEINMGSSTNAADEYIDAMAAFGGVKKNIISKNFKGGEITCFMGGAELDLTQADIQGTVLLDITNVFGGTKLVIPANWSLRNEMVPVFGGVDEKRNVSTVMPDANKTLLLKGACVFGGIEIRSY